MIEINEEEVVTSRKLKLEGVEWRVTKRENGRTNEYMLRQIWEIEEFPVIENTLSRLEYFDDGDAENGPRIGSDWVDIEHSQMMGKPCETQDEADNFVEQILIEILEAKIGQQ